MKKFLLSLLVASTAISMNAITSDYLENWSYISILTGKSTVEGVSTPTIIYSGRIMKQTGDLQATIYNFANNTRYIKLSESNGVTTVTYDNIFYTGTVVESKNGPISTFTISPVSGSSLKRAAPIFMVIKDDEFDSRSMLHHTYECPQGQALLVPGSSTNPKTAFLVYKIDTYMFRKPANVDANSSYIPYVVGDFTPGSEVTIYNYYNTIPQIKFTIESDGSFSIKPQTFSKWDFSFKLESKSPSPSLEYGTAPSKCIVTVNSTTDYSVAGETSSSSDISGSLKAIRTKYDIQSGFGNNSRWLSNAGGKYTNAKLLKLEAYNMDINPSVVYLGSGSSGTSFKPLTLITDGGKSESNPEYIQPSSILYTSVKEEGADPSDDSKKIIAVTLTKGDYYDAIVESCDLMITPQTLTEFTTYPNNETGVAEAKELNQYAYTPAQQSVKRAVTKETFKYSIPKEEYQNFSVYARIKPTPDVQTDYNLFAGLSYPNMPTGIESIEADSEAPAQYFNLQGVRVENPSNGIFIVRKGSKTYKHFFK